MPVTHRNFVGSDFTRESGAPCAACLSKHEQKAIIVFSFAAALGLNVKQILANSNCLTCMSKGQKQTAVTTILAETYGPEDSFDRGRELISCLRCATPDQLDAAMLYGLANLLGWAPD